MATKKANNTKKEETKKTTTAKKTTTTKKSTAKKTTTTKKAAPKKTTQPKKTTAAKKPAAKKKTTPKKVEKVELPKTKKEVAKEVVTPVETETDVVINEPIKEVQEPIKEEEIVIEKKEEVTITPEVSPLVDNKNDRIKTEKRIDIGIIVVIVGLITLIVTTYLSSSTSIPKSTIDILVIISLAIELAGIIVIIYNTIKSNR